jgi:hypothetical protein
MQYHPVEEEARMNNRTVFALLASGTLLAGPAAAAQRWGSGPTPDSGACFYEYPNFRGRYFCARTGDELPFIPNGMNDRIMSIRLFGNARVIVNSYPRFGGAENWFDYSVRDLRYEGWDDRISSVRLSWDRAYWDPITPGYRYRDYDRPLGSNDTFEGRPNDRYREQDHPRYGDEQDHPRYGDEQDHRRYGESSNSSANADAIVRRAYQDLLHRDPDPEGLQQYRDQILREGWSDAQVRASIMQSPEYRNQGSRGTTSREQAQQIVRQAYLATLKREPDPGSATWVDKVVNDHWTQADVENALRNSAEYKSKNPAR